MRAAVRAKQGNAAAAEQSARKALLLDPELDASTFPPSVQEAIARTQQSLPARVVVKVIDLPEGAQVRVDGRTVTASGIITVVPGSHQLAVRAGGKTSLKSFTAEEDTEVSAGRGAVAVATPVATPTPAAITTPKPSPTPRVGGGGRGKRTAGYALAAIAISGAGAAGHGYWARGVSLENQKTTETQKDAYDDDIDKFTTQTAAGGGLALVAGGLAVWLLSSGSGRSAYIAPREGGAVVGFTMEFGGNE